MARDRSAKGDEPLGGGSADGDPAGGQLPLFGPGAAPGAGEGQGTPGAEGAGDPQMSGASGVSAPAGPAAAGVRPAAQPPEILDLAARLPPGIHLGGSTWSFPGWAGLVYDRPYPTARLAREGLAAYARHPLLRAVGIDRTHYRPLPAEDLASYAAAVPDDFLFLVKAHEVCTLAQFPDHPRYGAERNQPNPLFLDPAYAAAEVVAPYAAGLEKKGGALLFQFAPQELGPPRRFAARLKAFLTALPQGPQYAVELRNRELLTADYAAALAAAGACHCLNVHPRMPDVRVQSHLAGVATSPMTLGRWLLGTAATYEAASKRFAPFNRLQAPDPTARRALAELAGEALAAGRPFLLTVNNNAEGSAPLSIAALARELLSLRQSVGE
jgi:uncharacterized protein YecE (DUF72 family)